MKAWCAALAALALACSDKNPIDPVRPVDQLKPAPPQGLVVSNAQSGATPVGVVTAGATVNYTGGPVAYLSAEPGTFSNGDNVTVRNDTRASAPQFLAIVNGGFDPVGIEAAAGDELSLTVVSAVGGTTTSFVKVPVRRPPGVVRTEPSKGRIDVALNVQVGVVFSEPVDRSTVNAATLALLRNGQPVAGRIQVSDDGLGAQFVPDNLLAPETEYSLEIGKGIHDLDGEALDVPYAVDFKTGTGATLAESELVFTRWSDGQIYKMGFSSRFATRLTTDGVHETPRWSPDGRRIAYAMRARFATAGDIYTMDPDGSNVTRHTFSGIFRSAAWSPDSRKLLISDEGIYVGSVWLINVDEDHPTPMMLATDARNPAWSPDGKQIVYVHLSGDDGYQQIYSMNPDGTGEHPITEQDAGAIYGLTWSPDGKRLAFSKCLFGACAIYAMNADGSEWTTMTTLPSLGGASWSPNGKWIAYSIDRSSGGNWTPDIGYVSADGRDKGEIADGVWPSWRR